MRRALRWIGWYLSTGVAVAIVFGAHQATRQDPGFDPLFVTVVTVFVWPIVVAQQLQILVLALSGALPRH